MMGFYNTDILTAITPTTLKFLQNSTFNVVSKKYIEIYLLRKPDLLTDF